MWIVVSLVAGAYLIGSIPFGVIIGRARGVDIRKVGSGNIGATNVGRMIGKKWGVLCFVLDFLKGAVPVTFAGLYIGVWGHAATSSEPVDVWIWMLVALAAVLGHMFSIFLKFNGGKGVATGLGALGAMWPLLTISTGIAVIVWIVAVKSSRYVSVASMTAIGSMPVSYTLGVLVHSLARGEEFYFFESLAHASAPLIVTLGLALLVVYKHRGNIARIRRGEEPKFGE